MVKGRIEVRTLLFKQNEKKKIMSPARSAIRKEIQLSTFFWTVSIQEVVSKLGIPLSNISELEENISEAKKRISVSGHHGRLLDYLVGKKHEDFE
jgi:RecG-like helicase